MKGKNTVNNIIYHLTVIVVRQYINLYFQIYIITHHLGHQ